jgi:hypothetical protein
MAIFVSNPTSAAVPTLSSDALEPMAIAPEEGFTEELAAAMQPSALLAEAAAAPNAEKLDEPDKKLTDLQILPADVLLNAVADANFALSAQSAIKASAAQSSLQQIAQQEAQASSDRAAGVALEQLNSLQAAELAAANLAAQMASPSISPPVKGHESHSESLGTISPIEVSNLQALQSVAATQELKQSIDNAANSLPSALANVSSAALNSEKVTTQLQAAEQHLTKVSENEIATILLNAELNAIKAASQSEVEIANSIASSSVDTLDSVLGKENKSATDVVNAASASASAMVSTFSNTALAAAPVNDVLVSNDLAKSADVAIASRSTSTGNPNRTQDISSEAFNPSSEKVSAKTTAATDANPNEKSAFNFDAKLSNPESDAKAKYISDTPASLAAAVKPNIIEQAPVVLINQQASKTQDSTAVQPNTTANSLLSPAEKSLAPSSSLALETNQGSQRASATQPVLAAPSSLAPGSSLALETNQGLQRASATQPVLEASITSVTTATGTVTRVDAVAQPSNSSANSTLNVQETARPEPLRSLDELSSTSASNAFKSTSQTPGNNANAVFNLQNQAQSGVAKAHEQVSSPSVSSLVESIPQQADLHANAIFTAQEEASSVAAKSFDELSSTFVSSLVGGPQRPMTTVMDWVSMKSQELPAPVVPHEVRLDSGAVQLEIQKMVRQGGGHVVMELTPPDQSKFTIELKLDERGNALLIVEGVSDSTKTRLEQSAPQLREQFQQMGLELQLDMRQQGQSASSNAANFADAQERGSADNNLANNGAGDTPKVLTPREAGANRARESGSNQVYLYA